MSKKVKIIYQYILREVSEIVIYYLQLIQLFVEILQILYRGQDKSKAFLQELELEEQWNNNEDKEDKEDKEDRNNQEKINMAEWSNNKGGDKGKGDRERLQDLSKLEKVRLSNLNSFWATNCVYKVIQ